MTELKAGRFPVQAIGKTGAVPYDPFPHLSITKVADDLASAIQEYGAQDAPVPNVCMVSELAWWINKFIERPWTAEDIKNFRAEQKLAKAERQKLLDAVEILSRRLNSFQEEPTGPPPFPNAQNHRLERINSLNVAIAELLRPYSYHDGYFPEIATTGPAPKPWAVMARKIAYETLKAINTSRIAAKLDSWTTFGAENGPIVCFIRRMLMRILKRTPKSTVTILDAINLLTLRRNAL